MRAYDVIELSSGQTQALAGALEAYVPPGEAVTLTARLAVGDELTIRSASVCLTLSIDGTCSKLWSVGR